jgi:hypothetical protein
MSTNKSPYPALYNLIFIVHPPTDESPYWGLELDLSRLTGFLAFAYAVFLTWMFSSEKWTPGLQVIVAVLTFLAGILGLVFLSSLPLDKMRIAGTSKVPSELANSVGKLMPLDKEPGRVPDEDERDTRKL